MRKSFVSQGRFDCTPVFDLQLNLSCRDEIVPMLGALQHLFTQTDLRRKLCRLVANGLNPESRRDVGRPGFDDWQLLVLAVLRLGCNLDYDKLQDLGDNHQPDDRHLRSRVAWSGQSKCTGRFVCY